MTITSYRRHCWLRLRPHAWRNVSFRALVSLWDRSTADLLIVQKCEGCGRNRLA